MIISKHILAVISFFAVLLGCHYSSYYSTDEECFAIYTLADPTISAAEASRMPLEKLVLSSRPFLTSSDIIKYRWADHTIYFKNRAIGKIRKLMQKGPHIKLFVVTAGNERIYLGAFWALYSSLGRFLPHISCPPMDSDSVTIRKPWRNHNNKEDMRNDVRIYNCLAEMALLLEE